MLARLIAVMVHEIVTEYRKLDSHCGEAAEDAHRYDPASTTASETERAPGWDHDKASPVTGFGFSRPACRPVQAHVQEQNTVQE